MKRSRPRLLIGERDPFMRRALERVLHPDYELTFVEDGASLITQTRTRRPDLIILEGLLPVMDGFQVCRELKRDPTTRYIPVLFFTLLSAEERARQAGADAFLLKPLRESVLRETIESLLKTT